MAKKEVIEDRLFYGGKRRQPEKTVVKVAAVKKKRSAKKVEDRVRTLDSGARIIVIVSILGMLVSSYLTWLSYSPFAKSFCPSCLEMVSGLAFLGIPEALYSFFGFLFIFLTSLSIVVGYDWSWLSKRIRPKHCVQVLIFLASLKFLLSVYVSCIRLFWLDSFCMLCIVSLILTTIILGIALSMFLFCRKWRKEYRQCGVDSKSLCRYC